LHHTEFPKGGRGRRRSSKRRPLIARSGGTVGRVRATC
jgi:hypothetical protein